MTSAGDSKRIEDLQKVLEISRSMVAAADLDTLLKLIVDRSMELLGAERATLFLYEPQTASLYSRIAHGVKEIRMPADRGIAGACIRGRAVLNVPDAYADPRFNPDFDRASGFHTRNILAVPLYGYSGDLVGVLEVINKLAGGFGAYDIALAETLAAQAGVAIQRANLIRHYLQKQKMERDMEIARQIQQDLLPASNPRVEGFDIAGFSQPADQTGGDTYDFIPLGDGRLATVVADATGHGIGPALVIAETRAMLRALSGQVADVSLVLTTVNSLLAADLGDARFVTCFFGVLDPARSCLTFASAGHGPILLYDRRRDEFRQQKATGLPLGVLDDVRFDQVISQTLAAGDFAAILTDGLFEAFSPAGESFGIERVIDLLRCCRDMPAEQMVENLRTAVMSFSAELPQADDLTAILIRRVRP